MMHRYVHHKGVTRHIRNKGRSLEGWEKENRRLIEVRLKMGLELLPWMEEWLKKRNLVIEGEGKKRTIGGTLIV